MHNPQLEEQVLAYAIQHPEKFIEVREKFKPRDFSVYGRMWTELLKYHESYQNFPSSQAVTEIFSANENDLQFVEVYNRVRTIPAPHEDFLFHLDKFYEYSVGNGLLTLFERGIETINKQGGIAAQELIRKSLVTREQFEEYESQVGDKDSISERFREYVGRRDDPEQFRGVSCGIKKIDRATWGWQKGELILVVGAAKGGKSMTLLNFAYYPYMFEGKNVVFFTLENRKAQTLRRFDARHSMLSYEKLKKGTLTPEEERRYQEKLVELNKRSNIFHVIDIPRTCTAQTIEAKLVTLNFPIDLIVVDYQGVMTSRGASNKGGDWEVQGQVTWELKQVARVFNAPLLTAAQLNREGANRETPDIRHVARSWLLVANCDAIILLGQIVGREGESPTGELPLWIGVHRDAPPTAARVFVDFERMYLGNLEQEVVSNAMENYFDD